MAERKQKKSCFGKEQIVSGLDNLSIEDRKGFIIGEYLTRDEQIIPGQLVKEYIPGINTFLVSY